MSKLDLGVIEQRYEFHSAITAYDTEALLQFAKDAKSALEKIGTRGYFCRETGRWEEHAREVLEKHFGDEK